MPVLRLDQLTEAEKRRAPAAGYKAAPGCEGPLCQGRQGRSAGHEDCTANHGAAGACERLGYCCQTVARPGQRDPRKLLGSAGPQGQRRRQAMSLQHLAFNAALRNSCQLSLPRPFRRSMAANATCRTGISMWSRITSNFAFSAKSSAWSLRCHCAASSRSAHRWRSQPRRWATTPVSNSSVPATARTWPPSMRETAAR